MADEKETELKEDEQETKKPEASKETDSKVETDKKTYAHTTNQKVAEDETESKVEKAEDDFADDLLTLRTLPFWERQKEKRRRRKAKFAKMSGGEKFKYFLFYYKYKVIIGLLLAGLIGYGIYEIVLNFRPVAISYAIVNNGMETDTSPFYDYAEAVHKSEDDGYQITGDANVSISLETLDEKGSTLSTDKNYTLFPQRCADGKFDVIVTDSKGLDYLLQEVGVRKPEQVLDQDIFDKVKEHLADYKGPDGVTDQYAFDITDTELAKKMGMNYQPVYLVFTGITEDNTNNAIEFTKYLYQIEGAN